MIFVQTVCNGMIILQNMTGCVTNVARFRRRVVEGSELGELRCFRLSVLGRRLWSRLMTGKYMRWQSVCWRKWRKTMRKCTKARLSCPLGSRTCCLQYSKPVQDQKHCFGKFVLRGREGLSITSNLKNPFLSPPREKCRTKGRQQTNARNCSIGGNGMTSPGWFYFPTKPRLYQSWT